MQELMSNPELRDMYVFNSYFLLYGTPCTNNQSIILKSGPHKLGVHSVVLVRVLVRVLALMQAVDERHKFQIQVLVP